MAGQNICHYLQSSYIFKLRMLVFSNKVDNDVLSTWSSAPLLEFFSHQCLSKWCLDSLQNSWPPFWGDLGPLYQLIDLWNKPKLLFLMIIRDPQHEHRSEVRERHSSNHCNIPCPLIVLLFILSSSSFLQWATSASSSYTDISLS